MSKLDKLRAIPTLKSLQQWHTWLAGLFGVQAVVILLLSSGKTLPVSGSFLTVDSLQSVATGSTVLAPATHHLFELNLGYLVAAFLLIPAIVHLSKATWYRTRYEADLAAGVDRLRWLGYAVSLGLAAIAVAMLSGMYDIVSLALIGGLGITTNLLVLAAETQNPLRRRGETKWMTFVIAGIAGVLPWLAIGAYLVFAGVFGSGHLPAFVYWLYGSTAILFASYGAVQYLYFKKRGPWKSYLFTERSYMLHNLLVLAIIAWQIYAGALAS